MKYLIYLTLCFAVGFAPPPIGYTVECRVIRIIDGDTVDVEIRKVVRVRLLSCWAPETRTKDKAEKKRGLASKANLVKLAEGKDVVLHIPGSKRLSDSFSFGRVLGDVYVDGKSVAVSQVEGGFATKEK